MELQDRRHGRAVFALERLDDVDAFFQLGQFFWLHFDLVQIIAHGTLHFLKLDLRGLEALEGFL